MIKNLFHKLNGLKKYLNCQRCYMIPKSSKELSSGISPIISDIDFKLENPSLAYLVESFQRYGFMRVASSSNTISHELNNTIEYLKKKPINLKKMPSYLGDCKDYEALVKKLNDLYSNNIGIEYLHINSIEERDWLSKQFSARDEFYKIDDNSKIEYLKLINRAEQFDIFLGKKFQSVKRYSGEGVESAMVCFLEIFKSAAKYKICNIVIAMAHRSRNNLLTTILKYPPVLYFRKMLGLSEFPEHIKFPTGDTFSHFFHSMDFVSDDNFPVHVSLIPNPSHLEANIPVGAGKTRSKMQFHHEGDYSLSTSDNTSRNGDKVLGIFIHGDASVFGQGIVPESLVMTDSSYFSIGGSIHVVINNNLGFTTETPSGSKNVTDIAKIVNCPIIHVNAYSVIDVAKAAMLAMDYRNLFRKDIFINLIGYRRWGHNELDDPTITQPLMYSKIANRKSISEEYSTFLINKKYLKSMEEIEKDREIWIKQLNDDLQNASNYQPELMTFKNQWSNQNILDIDLQSLGIYNTGFCVNKLKEIGKYSVFIPPKFAVHSNVFKTHIQKRLTNLNSTDSGNIDWATAEALAIGSLLAEGHNCRISGQDVGRGTFSHRHFSLVNQETNELIIPFNVCHWDPGFSNRGFLEVANSILSEEAVLGFEIGMALDNPNNLNIWEAQFGDFFNGAQILIDTYLGSAETKWLLQNGLVLLLPHGYDGAGPEHSSCRLERFLQITDSLESGCDSDSVNMHVINPTTPAQYFHALRRQIIRPFRRPLIVASPKILLRSLSAVSCFEDIKDGTHFQHILSDGSIENPEDVKTLILCSGKHYYALKHYLKSSVNLENQNKYAIIRIEQLAPFPITEIKREFDKFKKATKFVWSQEEARNMGAWQFVNIRIRNMLGINLYYVGRKESPTPAVGIGNIHKKEVEYILSSSFK